MMTPETDFPFVLRQKQFPIQPAYCITIKNGQVQNLEFVGIFLPSPQVIFQECQTYGPRAICVPQ